MGIFDRVRKNSIQINDVDPSTGFKLHCGWDSLFSKRNRKGFSDLYLYTALNYIYDGISNIRFTTSKNITSVNSIINFIDANAALLVSKYIEYGYIAIFFDKDNNYFIPDYDSALKKDMYGRIVNRNAIVIYSPLYQTSRKSLLSTVRPLLSLIDDLANTLVSSCNTMGVLPIISGSSIPANPKFKEELAETMSRRYGWGDDKLKYFLSQAELKVDSINLQIKDLEIRENIENVFKRLLNAFNIPSDLIIGGSTFSNVSEARKYFYDTCIRNYAEVLLKLIRNMVTNLTEFIPQSTVNYSFSNVPEMEKTLSSACAEKSAYIDLLTKLSESGIDVENEMEKVFRDIKQIYVEV